MKFLAPYAGSKWNYCVCLLEFRTGPEWRCRVIERISSYMRVSMLRVDKLSSTTLSASIVTTAWRILRLRVKATASRYGGWLRIYWISSRGQSTKGGPPASMFDVRLKTPSVKSNFVTKCYERLRAWTDYLDKRPKLDWSVSGYGLMEGSCEHGNEPSDSIKCWEILE
jgi:hypothetical protein